MKLEQAQLSRRLLLGAGVLLAASCEGAGPMAPATAGKVAPVTGYATIDGLKVYYEVHGGAPNGAKVPFVVLPGGMLAIETGFGDDFLSMLAAIRPVIAIEQQGHGHTGDREGPITLARMIEDTDGVLDHLGVAKGHFIGHSMGGMIALGMAIRHPDRVASLTPVSAMANLDGYIPEMALMQRDPTHVPSAAVIPMLPTEEDFAAWKAHYDKHNPNPAAFETVLGKLNAMLTGWKGFTDAQLSAITAPTLVVIGDNDFVRIEHAAEMKRKIPGANLAVLPGTMHMNIIDRSAWLVPMVEARIG